MGFGLDIKGLEEAVAMMGQLRPREMAPTMATALTRVAVKARDAVRNEAVRSLDKLTPYTLRAFQYKAANARDVRAEVRIADDETATAKGTPGARYMWWQVEGGSNRQTKRFERALQAAGMMPKGWYAIPATGPGSAARVDGYGNISPGQIVQILSQLRAGQERGSLRHMARGDDRKAVSSRRRAKGRAGGEFIVVQPGAPKLKPGIYLLGGRDFGARWGYGRNGKVKPVLLFVRSVAYERRYDFHGAADKVSAELLPGEMLRAVQERLARRTA